MATFYEVFSPTQQFLLLQAYVDQVLTEDELLNFSLLTTTEQVPVVFYDEGMLVITPALRFGEFTHVLIPAQELQVRQVQENLEVAHGDERWVLPFQTEDEASQMQGDLVYLFSQKRN